MAQGLADALERFGTLEAVIQAKTGERDALAAEATELTAANATLHEEQTTIRAGLEAVAQEGRPRIARMEKTATAAIEAERAQTQAAMANLDARMAATLDRLAGLNREAAELEKFVGWARALASRNPEEWRFVAPEAWASFLWHLGRWVEAVGFNPDVALPEPLRSRVEDQAKYPTLYGPVRVPLLGLAGWLADGLREVPAVAVLTLTARAGKGVTPQGTCTVFSRDLEGPVVVFHSCAERFAGGLTLGARVGSHRAGRPVCFDDATVRGRNVSSNRAQHLAPLHRSYAGQVGGPDDRLCHACGLNPCISKCRRVTASGDGAQPP